jgi:hypothetical protein
MPPKNDGMVETAKNVTGVTFRSKNFAWMMDAGTRLVNGALVHCTRRRIAVIRRQVKRLAAERPAQAERICRSDRFRPLTKAEADALVGGELLTSLPSVLKS